MQPAAWVQILTLSFTSYVTLNHVLNLSASHLQNGDNDITIPLGSIKWVNKCKSISGSAWHKESDD